jgi:hypothetical protein
MLPRYRACAASAGARSLDRPRTGSRRPEPKASTFVPAQRLPHPGLESPRLPAPLGKASSGPSTTAAGGGGGDDDFDDLLYRKASPDAKADARMRNGQPPIPAAALYQTGGPAEAEADEDEDEDEDDADSTDGSPVVWPEGKPLPRRLQEKRERQERRATRMKQMTSAFTHAHTPSSLSPHAPTCSTRFGPVAEALGRGRPRRCATAACRVSRQSQPSQPLVPCTSV